MNDEMRGLMCGTSIDLTYDDDETTSEEESTTHDIPSEKETVISPSQPAVCDNLISFSDSSGITCKLCTTLHVPPIPVCCESCCNVLQPDNLSKEQVWSCMANACHGTEMGYLNYIDSGICGICGVKRGN
jgi:hypothetical protein